MLKRLLTVIILCLAILLSFAACGGGEVKPTASPSPTPEPMPAPSLPPYPEIEETLGYAISGYVLDSEDNGLLGAMILVDDKIMAITDEDGFYTINALTGNNIVSVSYADYVFNNTSYTVSTTRKNVNFIGIADYSININSYTQNNAPLYGVVYYYTDKLFKSEDMSGNTRLLNIEGKITVTPYKQGFTFIPKSQDVYQGGTVDFLAVPDSNTFSVSGVMNFASPSDMKDIFVYVNDVKYTKCVITPINGENKALYTIYGLTPHADLTQYRISAGAGWEGFISTEQRYITGETNNVNFDMKKVKEINVVMKFSPSLESSQLRNLSFNLVVRDEYGNEYSRIRSFATTDVIGVVVWAGCRVSLYGDVLGKEFVANAVTISEDLILGRTNEIDMRCEFQ